MSVFLSFAVATVGATIARLTSSVVYHLAITLGTFSSFFEAVSAGHIESPSADVSRTVTFPTVVVVVDRGYPQIMSVLPSTHVAIGVAAISLLSTESLLAVVALLVVSVAILSISHGLVASADAWLSSILILLSPHFPLYLRNLTF
jgi:hypothetical protein